MALETTMLDLCGKRCLDIDDAPAAGQEILAFRSVSTAVTQRDGIVEGMSDD